jgi:hypothetical protein
VDDCENFIDCGLRPGLESQKILIRSGGRVTLDDRDDHRVDYER